jgi:hypothetical protein
LDDRQVILDRRNFKTLALFFDQKYTVPSNGTGWLKRGFLIVELRENSSKYYVIEARSNRVVVSGSYIYNNKEFARGESDYFIVHDEQQGQAIFDKDGKQIADWFDRIYAYGLRQGSSDYYLATKDGKQAFFYKDGTQSSDWFDEIEASGLANGQSDYYIAKKDGKEAIFHKSGKQISYWFNWINPYGLVSGYSDYYVGSARGGLYIGKLGSTRLLGPFKDIKVLESLDYYAPIVPRFNPSLTNAAYTFDGREIIISKQEAEQFFGKEDIDHEEEK